ncbi:MAG: sugar phosphate permease, partial [Candidatus Latescibacterota bacterium]
ALLAYRIERTLGRKKALISLILLSTTAYLLLSQFQSLWAAPILFIFYLVRGINGPVLNDYLNRIVTSDIRATVLSVKSLIGRLMFVILGPIMGWVNDAYSLGMAFLMAGCTFLILGIFSLWRLHKNNVL